MNSPDIETMEPFKALAHARWMPVASLSRADLAVPLAEALADEGLPILEITFRTPAVLSALEAVRRRYPRMLLGAGTVLKPSQARDAVAAGAKFLVSPGYLPEVGEAAAGLGVPYLPGIFTATELTRVVLDGWTAAKVFPAEAGGGAALLKALSGPFPEMLFVPTGGIHLRNAQPYLDLPSVMAVGVGDLCPNDLMEAGRWAEVRTRIRQYLGLTLDRAQAV